MPLPSSLLLFQPPSFFPPLLPHTWQRTKTYTADTHMYSICQNVQKEITEFKQHARLIQVVCNQGLRDRHWKRMSEVVGANIAPDSSTTLQHMIELNLQPYLDVSLTACLLVTAHA